MTYITASKLYDYIQCPHRIWRDANGPQEEKIDETNPFVELLWEKGVKHEEKIVSQLGDFLDLSEGTHEERFAKTTEAMKSKASLIYQGVLICENMLGIPDLLKKLPDDTYMPVDIKSGMGFEGVDEETGEEGKPKKHYAVQLCLYNDLLKKLGFCTHNNGVVIDIHGEHVEYDLVALMGPRSKKSWWEFYEEIKKHVDFLLNNQHTNKPAMAGICKLCPWYNSCKGWCEETKDLTNVFYLGRSNRDKLNEDLLIESLDEFVDLDIEEAMKQKENEKKSGNKDFLYRIGKDSLAKAVCRANILCRTKKPVLYGTLDFPKVSHELFFDIEDDPSQDFVYLHGVYERSANGEKFIHFTAKEITDDSEKRIWQDFWNYINTLPPDDFAVYYYAHHEKTTYKRLQKRYPDVITLEEVENFYDNPNVIDLYSVIQKQTDWPVGSYSLKALATYLKFKWRDKTPSGALSIQWFNEYLETKDESIMKRILEYNEDDCKATMILKDALEKL
ncbi:TM0106 family RecB-like putative nuclease [Patescibacteria group bacterium]|nr:TM0106 family RecB-like putative nuclease [Patescibacteria group bacterium]